MTKTKQLAIGSMLSAMCAVLGAFSLDFGNLKLTFESLPILLGAAMFGPLQGAAIGFVGTFLYQMLRYGFTATTLLWILPYCVYGILVGSYTKRRRMQLTRLQAVFIVVAAELAVTTMNTGVLYIDSRLYGYYSAVYIFGTLLPRYAICVGKALAIGALFPALLGTVRRVCLKGSRTA